VSKSRPSMFKNLSLYMVTTAVQVVLPVLTVPIFTRLIHKEQYGILDMLQIAVIFGVGCGNWGLVSAFERYFFAYAESRAKQLRLLGTLVAFTLACFAVVFGVLLLTRNPLVAYLTEQAGWGPLLLMAFAAGCLNHVNSFFFSFYKNAERAVPYVVFTVARVLVSIGLSLGLVIGGHGIWGIVIGQLVAQGLVLIAFVARIGLLKMSFDLAIFKECFHYAWPLMARVLIGLIPITVDKFMLGKMRSMGELGVYGRAQALAFFLFTLMTTVQNVYAPKWSQRLFKLEGSDRSLGSLFTEYVCIIIVPAVLLGLFAREVVIVMMPPEYHGAVPVVMLLTLFYALLAFGKLIGPVGAYLKMTRFMAAMSAVSMIGNVALNYLLIPRYGGLGAALATCITGLGTTVAAMAVYSRRQHVGYEKGKLMLLYGGLFACVLVAGACMWLRLSLGVGLAVKGAALAGFMIMLLRIIGYETIRRTVRQGLTLIGLGQGDTVPDEEADGQ